MKEIIIWEREDNNDQGMVGKCVYFPETKMYRVIVSKDATVLHDEWKTESAPAFWMDTDDWIKSINVAESLAQEICAG
jgi:hypothetical protein